MDKEKVLKASEGLFCQDCINMMALAKQKMRVWELANPRKVRKMMSDNLCSKCKKNIAGMVKK